MELADGFAPNHTCYSQGSSKGTTLGPCPVLVWQYKCPKILGSNLMHFYWSYDTKIIQNRQTEKFGGNTGLLSHL